VRCVVTRLSGSRHYYRSELEIQGGVICQIVEQQSLEECYLNVDKGNWWMIPPYLLLKVLELVPAGVPIVLSDIYWC